MYAPQLSPPGEAVTPRPSAGPSPDVAPYRAVLQEIFARATERFDVRFWNGEVMRFGAERDRPPEFTVAFKDRRALLALDEASLGESFIAGHWDVEGDSRGAFGLRKYIPARFAVGNWASLLGRIFLVSDRKNNAEAIAAHYSLGDDFYLTFIDQKYRIYSHGHFRHPDESLEDAEEHKLQDMFDMLQLKPGMRLLDIGGGWGPVPQFCGERGVRVTSVTLAKDSHAYISRLIQERKLPCEVVRSDYLEYRPAEPFDAIVIYGVIEHIPQYKRFVEKIYRDLKPGGLMFLDGSASRFKYDMNPVAKKYIWPTTTAYMSTHDLIAELNYQGMDLLELKNESFDYELTMLHWSRRFEAAKDFIVGRWGEKLYRMFRIYLWSGHLGFRDDRLQAYRLLIRRGTHGPGPRPGLLRRIAYSAMGPY